MEKTGTPEFEKFEHRIDVTEAEGMEFEFLRDVLAGRPVAQVLEAWISANESTEVGDGTWLGPVSAVAVTNCFTVDGMNTRPAMANPIYVRNDEGESLIAVPWPPSCEVDESGEVVSAQVCLPRPGRDADWDTRRSWVMALFEVARTRYAMGDWE